MASLQSPEIEDLIKALNRRDKRLRFMPPNPKNKKIATKTVSRTIQYMPGQFQEETSSTSSPKRRMTNKIIANNINLFIASNEGDIATVRKMLSEPHINVNFFYPDTTPLMDAAENGHTGIVRLLLQNKAKVNLRDKVDNSTALIKAARSGHKDIVRLLLQNGAFKSTKDVHGADAFYYGLINQDVGVLQLL